MRKKGPVLVTLGAILAVGLTASAARAQCNLEGPAKAGKIQLSLVQAYVPCAVPNDVTQGGLPSCSPPQTYNEAAAGDPTGWRWDGAKGQGAVQMKSSDNLGSSDVLLNPPGDTVDISLSLKLKGVVSISQPAGATGAGSLDIIGRATIDDRAGGEMTVQDFTTSFPVGLSEGSAKVKSSANAILNAGGLHGLPNCSRVEITSVELRDGNGNWFGKGGVIPL